MRLSHTGSVCAGDYIKKGEAYDPNDYMISAGNYFMFMIYFGWIANPAILITAVCIVGEKWAQLALDSPK